VAVLAQAGGESGSVGNANPISDFSYGLTKDGTGVIINNYTGKGGKVVIPAIIENLPVKEIYGSTSGSGAFRDKETVTSIVVPDSVEVIGMNAFCGMDELTQVTLPNGLKIIPHNAFIACIKLTKVNLPSSLEQIGPYAFAGCELTEFSIPDSLTKIKFVSGDDIRNNYEKPDNGAFAGCVKLPSATRQRIRDLGYKGEF